MDIPNVLLSPKGRLGPRDFLRGLILVTAAYILVQLVGTFVSPGFSVLIYPMIYVYVCLFSKRLHDAGHSGWLYLLFLLGYTIGGSIISAMLMPFLSPMASDMIQQFMTSGDFTGAMTAMNERAEELTRKSALTTLASFLITSAVLGFIGARLPSDPAENRYGGPTHPSGRASTFS